jgi:SLIT-ROBO Rho GTPase activating protein
MEFKSYFEKDEDPLAFGSSQKDINAVAGVLKLYFRELVEPLFPSALFDALMDASS